MRHPLPRLHLALSLLAGLGFTLFLSIVAPAARAEDAPAEEKKETQFFEALGRDGGGLGVEGRRQRFVEGADVLVALALGHTG